MYCTAPSAPTCAEPTTSNGLPAMHGTPHSRHMITVESAASEGAKVCALTARAHARHVNSAPRLCSGSGCEAKIRTSSSCGKSAQGTSASGGAREASAPRCEAAIPLCLEATIYCDKRVHHKLPPSVTLLPNDFHREVAAVCMIDECAGGTSLSVQSLSVLARARRGNSDPGMEQRQRMRTALLHTAA